MLCLWGGRCERTMTSPSNLSLTPAEWAPAGHASTFPRRYARVHGEPFAKSLSARAGLGYPPHTSWVNSSGGLHTSLLAPSAHRSGKASASGSAAFDDSIVKGGGDSSSVGLIVDATS